MKIQRSGICLDHADILDGIRRTERVLQQIELAKFVRANPNQIPTLPVQFVRDQVTCDRQIQAVRDRERLSAADGVSMIAERNRVRQNLAIPPDLHQRGADGA